MLFCSSRAVMSEWFSSNQSLCFFTGDPRHSMTVLYTVLRKVVHAALTSCLYRVMAPNRSPTVSTNICLVGPSFSLVMLIRFGAFLPCGLHLDCTWMLTLDTMRRWSVQHSALHKALVILTSCLSLFLAMTYQMPMP